MPRPKHGFSSLSVSETTKRKLARQQMSEIESVKQKLPSLFAEKKFGALEGILDLVLDVLAQHSQTVACHDFVLGAVMRSLSHFTAEKKLEEEEGAKLAAEKAAVAKEPAEEELTFAEKLAFAEKVAGRLASPKVQRSKKELQPKPALKSATERAAAEERSNEAANEEASVEIDEAGQYHISHDSVVIREMAKEKAEKPVAENAAAEKKLAEEEAAKLPAEKAAVANEPAEEELAIAGKVAEMSASLKVQQSKKELQLHATPKSAAERAAAEERSNAAANEEAFVAIDFEGHYHVVHDRVVIRKGPSIHAFDCGFGRRDMEFIGTPCQVGETRWLRLNIEKSAALGAKLTHGITQAWILIDGTTTSLGYPVLLQRIKMTRAAIDKLVRECKPVIPDQQWESGRVWAVVGGVGKGGIIARSEWDLKSTAFDLKLAPGTLIEELKLQGNRLRYRRIRGDGPDFGWVTIEHNGKHLVEMYDKAAEEEDELLAQYKSPGTLAGKGGNSPEGTE